MNSWKRFDETSLQFYSKLNEEGISNIDHAQSQNLWELSETKTLVRIMIYKFKAILYYLLMCLKTLETSV